mgnify:CR=1 FL=1
MVVTNDFIPASYTNSIEQGVFQWSAPSNIALVKYWGKKENQVPANPSVSFTLNNCKTITQLAFAKKQNANQSNFSFDLLFEGKPKEDFKPKIQKFLELHSMSSIPTSWLPVCTVCFLLMNHKQQ